VDRSLIHDNMQFGVALELWFHIVVTSIFKPAILRLRAPPSPQAYGLLVDVLDTLVLYYAVVVPLHARLSGFFFTATR
jgi:hypothetical protein